MMKVWGYGEALPSAVVASHAPKAIAIFSPTIWYRFVMAFLCRGQNAIMLTGGQ